MVWPPHSRSRPDTWPESPGSEGLEKLGFREFSLHKLYYIVDMYFYEFIMILNEVQFMNLLTLLQQTNHSSFCSTISFS